jgi:hypothetical protein
VGGLVGPSVGGRGRAGWWTIGGFLLRTYLFFGAPFSQHVVLLHAVFFGGTHDPSRSQENEKAPE